MIFKFFNEDTMFNRIKRFLQINKDPTCEFIIIDRFTDSFRQSNISAWLVL